MSVRVMSAVWALDLPAGEKLLLLALADCANDDGLCWPGMKNLSAKTGKGERSLQAAIKALCAAGHLTRDELPGKGCNYTVHPQATLPLTPAEIAPRRNCAPQKTAQTPAEIAGKPSRTIRGLKAKASKPILASKKFIRPDDIPAEPWADFVVMRNRIGKPMTERAKELAVTRLRKLRDDDGWPPGDVLNHSTLNSYQGLFPPKDYQNGRSQQSGLRGTRPDPALDLYRAAVEAEEREDREADRRIGTALPSYGPS